MLFCLCCCGLKSTGGGDRKLSQCEREKGKTYRVTFKSSAIPKNTNRFPRVMAFVCLYYAKSKNRTFCRLISTVAVSSSSAYLCRQSRNTKHKRWESQRWKAMCCYRFPRQTRAFNFYSFVLNYMATRTFSETVD